MEVPLITTIVNIDIAMYFAVFAAKEEIGILIFFKEREVSI